MKVIIISAGSFGLEESKICCLGKGLSRVFPDLFTIQLLITFDLYYVFQSFCPAGKMSLYFQILNVQFPLPTYM